jgi:hypothetical protein
MPAMTSRAAAKLRTVALALGTALTAHDVVVHRAARLEHQGRVRRALLRTRPSR